ncbi:MAG: hypothetical protein ACTS73_07855 [Arsenophonus sp. NEOnobi-MAG3]
MPVVFLDLFLAYSLLQDILLKTFLTKHQELYYWYGTSLLASPPPSPPVALNLNFLLHAILLVKQAH